MHSKESTSHQKNTRAATKCQSHQVLSRDTKERRQGGGCDGVHFFHLQDFGVEFKVIVKEGRRGLCHSLGNIFGHVLSWQIDGNPASIANLGSFLTSIEEMLMEGIIVKFQGITTSIGPQLLIGLNIVTVDSPQPTGHRMLFHTCNLQFLKQWWGSRTRTPNRRSLSRRSLGLASLLVIGMTEKHGTRSTPNHTHFQWSHGE